MSAGIPLQRIGLCAVAIVAVSGCNANLASSRGNAGSGASHMLPQTAFARVERSAPGTESVIYRFKGQPDGEYPAAALVADAAVNLYGTTENGGKFCGTAACGTVYKLTPSAKGYNETAYA